jgi:hypothetical protein
MAAWLAGCPEIIDNPSPQFRPRTKRLGQEGFCTPDARLMMTSTDHSKQTSTKTANETSSANKTPRIFRKQRQTAAVRVVDAEMGWIIICHF